jgi:hypothetical protein
MLTKSSVAHIDDEMPILVHVMDIIDDKMRGVV